MNHEDSDYQDQRDDQDLHDARADQRTREDEQQQDAFDKEFTAQYLSDQRRETLHARLETDGALHLRGFEQSALNELEPIDKRRGPRVPKADHAGWDANTQADEIAPSPLLERKCDELAILLHAAGHGDGSSEAVLEMALLSLTLLVRTLSVAEFQQLKTELLPSQSASTIDVAGI